MGPGLQPRGPERRGVPRRAAEIKFHYAEVGLLAAALAAADEATRNSNVRPETMALDRLVGAARTYREAEVECQAERGPQPCPACGITGICQECGGSGLQR